METSNIRHCHILLKGKSLLTALETILIILREFEYLKGLVKLARKKKDTKTI
jgi:hypothetical protein